MALCIQCIASGIYVVSGNFADTKVWYDGGTTRWFEIQGALNTMGESQIEDISNATKVRVGGTITSISSHA